MSRRHVDTHVVSICVENSGHPTRRRFGPFGCISPHLSICRRRKIGTASSLAHGNINPPHCPRYSTQLWRTALLYCTFEANHVTQSKRVFVFRFESLKMGHTYLAPGTSSSPPCSAATLGTASPQANRMTKNIDPFLVFMGTYPYNFSDTSTWETWYLMPPHAQLSIFHHLLPVIFLPHIGSSLGQIPLVKE